MARSCGALALALFLLQSRDFAAAETGSAVEFSLLPEQDLAFLSVTCRHVSAAPKRPPCLLSACMVLSFVSVTLRV